jgi:hypothetical protein
LAILVLLFRRLPIVLALYKFIPAIRTWREAIFTGWFGPIGVGAIFYYTVALESIPEDGPNAHAREVLEPIIYFMVLSSVIAHGITIPLFYISKFATRTLTRTSDAGNQVLRIPKIEKLIGRKNSPPIFDEADLADVEVLSQSANVAAVVVDDTKPAPRHTAITILTPDDLRDSYRNLQKPQTPSTTRTLSPPDTPSTTPSQDGSQNGHNPARRLSFVSAEDDDSDEDSTYYLPISSKNSISDEDR